MYLFMNNIILQYYVYSNVLVHEQYYIYSNVLVHEQYYIAILCL